MSVHPQTPQLPRTIFDYWRVLVRYRVMIACLVVGATVITGINGKFFATKLYEAKATIMPAREEVMGGGLSFGGSGGGGSKGQGSGGGGSGIGVLMEGLGGAKSGPTIMETLHALFLSRRMAESVINELNLLAYYDAPSMSLAVDILRGETDLRRTPDKTYEIIILTRDPEMAARIANTYADKVDKLNRELSLTSTKRHRVFVEQRLLEKAKTLEVAEQALREFQTQHRTFDVSEQTEAAMQAVADLHGQIVQQEVELAALREYTTPDHPQIAGYQAQIAELRRQLDRLEQNQGGMGKEGKGRRSLSKKSFLAFEEAPTIALDYLRLMRKIKVEEAIYGMLLGTLEQAKITEMKDLPTVQVLDYAIVPERKSRPRTLQNVTAAFAIALVLGILLAFSLNYLEWVKAQENISSGAVAYAGVSAEASPSQMNGNGGRQQEIIPEMPIEVNRLRG